MIVNLLLEWRWLGIKKNFKLEKMDGAINYSLQHGQKKEQEEEEEKEGRKHQLILFIRK